MFKFIGAFITAVSLFKEIWQLIQKILGNDPKARIQEINEVFAKLNSAKTPEEKQVSAKEISDLIRKL